MVVEIYLTMISKEPEKLGVKIPLEPYQQISTLAMTQIGD